MIHPSKEICNALIRKGSDRFNSGYAERMQDAGNKLHSKNSAAIIGRISNDDGCDDLRIDCSHRFDGYP